MQQRAAAHPTEVATQLDLCALLRRAGRSAAAADVLTGLTEVGSRDIPGCCGRRSHWAGVTTPPA